MRAALSLVGDEELPIAFLLRGGGRARHVGLDRLRLLAEGMLSEAAEGIVQRYVDGPLFSTVRLLGETVELAAVPAPEF